MSRSTECRPPQHTTTAGQERFRTITSSYYRGAHGVMIVFDLTDQASFNNLNRWMQELDRYACENVSKIVVGAKADMVSKRVVDYATAKEYCDGLNVQYIETSARTNTNVQEAFLMLTSLIGQYVVIIAREERAKLMMMMMIGGTQTNGSTDHGHSSRRATG